VPINADQRRLTPTDADLPGAIGDALPVLMRQWVIGAVLEAQALAGGPVTSHEVRASRPILRSARALTELALVVARLGADEHGRTLHAAGKDRKGFALWWVQVPQAEAAQTEAPHGNPA
jgi:hypothetical protein